MAIRVTYFPAIKIDVDYHFRPPDDVLAQIQDQRTTLGDGTAFSAVAPFIAARSHRPSINILKRPRFQSSGSFRICDHCRSVGVLMA
ncbi:MAG: hypothetical protein WBZ51_16285 [Xanthobacteraceae bacterium]